MSLISATPAAAAPELLAALLRQVPFLTEEDIAAFVPLWHKSVRLQRGDFLIRPGQVEHHLYFVRAGTLRIFYPSQTEEICVGFAYGNTLVCSFPSFVAGQPSEYSIQALRKSELIGISRADFSAIVEARPNFARFWRLELERAVMGRIEREIDLLLPEPERRLARLLARSPHLFQLVPKKYIASYLRMTPETLSRLR
ncbi:cAMP-binding domain of CRP or a regulatory subunit of cAMP-dependent protein kinases [Hymenobacter daecheongensis DSM 21074]|uniref:cAMP-binding domain of CRP or a regulatory subunit of cAMP-dependent protein kinases n=1 Tax=Hymenobacter daecheongensis DSM 21074 TaxID=1121955 RepID=A0A1M6IL25_9BACT|nr:Crp/Fnr family transcriptional regulator [Hymenobacter daecheongensis]SHJ35181.1 cAMP-binding domain of CRP or a regulatory subunit of cAMP-dependent protein kinases [Hymenobacter daecheongensis DSM 21074]